MAKTVKELIEEIKLRAMATSHLEEVDSLFGVHFNEILQVHENELAEKDKLIKSQAYDCSKYLKIIKRNADERQIQLKKSDFHIWCKNCKKTLNTKLDKHCGYNPDVTISIISHSKYESLED